MKPLQHATGTVVDRSRWVLLVERDPDAVPLPQWQRDLLDERLSSVDTEEGRDWEEIKAGIWPEAR